VKGQSSSKTHRKDVRLARIQRYDNYFLPISTIFGKNGGFLKALL
jgi:hypothetical protein